MRWREQIGAAVAEDPTLVAAEWSAAVAALERSVPDIRQNLLLMKEKRVVRE